MLSSGLGSAMATELTGSLLLLTTIDQDGGEPRRTPLGYAVADGAVVVMAGDNQAGWFRNALADPRVEVVLPGTRVRGSASLLTDRARRRAALRALLGAAPFASMMVGEVDLDDDTALDETGERFPILAITPTAILPGPFDPGGWAPRVNTWLLLVALPSAVAAAVGFAVSRLARRR